MDHRGLTPDHRAHAGRSWISSPGLPDFKCSALAVLTLSRALKLEQTLM